MRSKAALDKGKDKSNDKGKDNDTDELQRKWVHPLCGNLVAVHGSQKSYALYFDDDLKKHLFIEVTENHCADHANVSEKIVGHSCKKKLTKAKTVEYRAKLLASKQK